MIFFKMFIILFSNLYLSYIQLIYKEIKKRFDNGFYILIINEMRFEIINEMIFEPKIIKINLLLKFHFNIFIFQECIKMYNHFYNFF